MGNATDHDDDDPELTDADFARARPFVEVFRELARKLRAQGGRHRLERPKVHVGFRLAAEVVEGIKATGKGSNPRVERVLREALAQGKTVTGTLARASSRQLSMLSPNFQGRNWRW